MPRFIFPLEGLLRHRRRLEREWQRDMAILQREARQLEEELRGLGEAMGATTADVRKTRLIGRLDMPFLAGHRRYLAAMQRKGTGLIQKLAALGPQIEARRTAVVAAAKDRKAIEKLKERRKDIWLAEQARRETAELDEISDQMFFAAQRGETPATREGAV
jgi:flagellar protein FliJ